MPIVNKDIIQVLYEILRDDMAIKINDVGLSELLANYADSDDLSFIFIPMVEARFDVKIPAKKWSEVGSLEEIAQMLEEISVEQNGI